MSLKEKTNAKNLRKGYRWHDELVESLLPYVKEEFQPVFPSKRELLNNIVRGYVPILFLPPIVRLCQRKWRQPPATGSYLNPCGEEIEDIGKEFAELTGPLGDKRIKTVFSEYNWKVDEPVEGISLLDKRGQWKYDAYKDKIAEKVGG